MLSETNVDEVLTTGLQQHHNQVIGSHVFLTKQSMYQVLSAGFNCNKWGAVQT